MLDTFLASPRVVGSQPVRGTAAQVEAGGWAAARAHVCRGEAGVQQQWGLPRGRVECRGRGLAAKLGALASRGWGQMEGGRGLEGWEQPGRGRVGS